MTTKTAPERMRLKQVMTATAYSLVSIRQAWRRYLRELAAERREVSRNQQRGWGA